MKCTKCPAPAFLQVDDRTVLCARCWNRITERLKADFNSLTSVSNPPEASPASDMAPSLIKSGAGSSFEYPDMPDFLRRAG